jgi:hypothetical protein
MKTRFATVVFALVALVFPPASSPARAGSCVPLSEAQLHLDPSYQILENQPDAIEIRIPDYGVVTFPPRGGALDTLQILTPQMSAPEDAFVLGVDYSACIDPVTGAGQVDFQRAGPYFIRAAYADGHVDHFDVHVISVPAGPAAGRGGWVQVQMPSNVNGYRGTEFGSDPTNFNTQGTLDGLISQIKTDYGNSSGPIDIALRYHGSSGKFQVGKGEWVSLDPNGRANFDKLCQALRGRAKSITLLSCRAAKGQKGCEFMNALSQCAGGVPVHGSNGKVTTTWKKNNPSGTVQTVTKGSMTSSGSCP